MARVRSRQRLAGRGSLLRSIFISYRREDSQGEAGRLFDDLTSAFTEREVFMDVDAIQPGLDFRIAIQESVQHCRVLLCLIGLDWVTCTNSAGLPRLADPNDFVRLEIAEALRRDIPVVPVLVRGALMPSVQSLPPDLVELAYRNAVEIGHTRWKSDVQVLVRALRPFVAEAAKDDPARVHPPSAPSSAARNEITLTAVHRLLQQVAGPSSSAAATPAASAATYPTLDEALFPAPPPQRAAANSLAQPPPVPPPPPGPSPEPSQNAIEGAAIERVRQQLAHYIGPIADIVVKRAARRCASLPDLYILVAKEIDAPPDRARFLSHVNSLQAVRPPNPPPPASSKP